MLRGGEDQYVGFLPLSLLNFDTEKTELPPHRLRTSSPPDSLLPADCAYRSDVTASEEIEEGER